MMLRLNIRTTPLKIEINTQPARLELKTVPAKLEIRTRPARVEIRQHRGELTIDQSPCRASYGYKDFLQLAREQAEAGRQAALEAIGRMAEEGNRLASIETGENAVAEIASDRIAYTWPELVLVPIPPPIIRYEYRPPEFNPVPAKVDYNLQPGKVVGEYRPGRVDIRVLQYNSIKMWTSEGKWDVLA